MVDKQIDRVLIRGQRYERFDQLRQRHFWSSYLFAPGGGNVIPAGGYEIFKVTPSQTGQGYPAGVPLTLLETNWKNAGRVPDNQNFVITEMGVTLKRPACMDNDDGGDPLNAPTNSIYANLGAGIQALINPRRAIHPDDAANILYGGVLEMSYLTNNVPMGMLSDFSQSGGVYAQEEQCADDEVTDTELNAMGDPCNGVPAAAFRRKLEVPVLLQHGEAMGMVIRFPRDVPTLALADGGAGWVEVRVDWWATESFAEKS
jgi:hypothetical protein